ncbi:ornithine cyclodeaminase [Bradyrhizobium sp. LTSP849]|uniref:ornithine cyclodeaminase family protein n=1 Tax=unclassified Bradyrhizobium TaxID=2631580 RepID=UPI0005D13F6B|nr:MULTISPECIES: ornithine cyclodeaminase family protein [unclassified Bradyrhizobium]KJC50620.1 ornithine cyclodeaminase [Bradyrhizobium sp. LTSP849]KJC53097.1 ornithine cyclodeaminase [Bradyrhizobium sp. LTSP857]
MLPYLTAPEINAGLDYPRLIDALDEAFRSLSERMPVRQRYDVGTTRSPGHLLTMPAWERGHSLGVKLVTVFPENAAFGLGAVSSVYVLLNAVTGQPRAIIDGEALTNRRTAATSALASRYLSRSDSSTLLLVGTGRLASCLPEAHRAVRSISKIIVWGRSRQRAITLANELIKMGFDARATDDLITSLNEADIVSCATTSREPIVTGRHLRPGTHLDLVGAFTPDMRESDDDAVCRSRVFVDTIAGALTEAGDLLQPIAAGRWSADDVCADLHQLAAGTSAGRLSLDEITLFKSVGSAIEDLVAASLLI